MIAEVEAEHKEKGLDNGIQRPALRFVKAAIAKPANTTSTQAVLLVEEKINERFIKYISNSAATPVAGLTGEELEKAEYLCFAQHFQYMATEHQFFISDYQGMDHDEMFGSSPS